MGKIESILGARRRGRFGCGFLAPRDVEEMLEGRLAEDRRRRFELHLQQGCVECLHLAAAVEKFRLVLDEGVLGVEAGQFARTEHGLKLRLREEFDRIFAGRGRHRAPWSGEIGTEDLERIVAAGPDTPPAEPNLDPDPEDLDGR